MQSNLRLATVVTVGGIFTSLLWFIYEVGQGDLAGVGFAIGALVLFVVQFSYWLWKYYRQGRGYFEVEPAAIREEQTFQQLEHIWNGME